MNSTTSRNPWIGPGTNRRGSAREQAHQGDDGSWPRRGSPRFPFLTALGLVAVTAAAVAAEAPTDLGSPTAPYSEAGLALRIEGARSAVGAVVSNVVLRVEANESPDPRMEAGPFRARWTGTLTVDLRGDYQFRDEHRGRFALTLNGTKVLPAEGDGTPAGWSAPVRLRKGTNTLEATLERTEASEADVRLWWRGRGVTPQPIPAAALRPLPAPGDPSADASASGDSVLVGREVFLRLRCGRCHLPEVAKPVPELAMDAPALDGIGSRLRREWMERWIADPKRLRPTSAMPRLLHGPATEVDAAGMAAWLSTLKDSAPAVGRQTPTGSPATGRALFGSLHCATCHTAPEEAADPAKVSLGPARKKFLPGALARFLLDPGAHFVWTPMPDFHLSAEEAGHLAAWLETEPAGAPTPRDPGAEGSPPPDPTAMARGRELVETAGCLNCHPAPTTNRHRAPRLASLPAETWNRGCLADRPPARGPQPWFDPTSAERSALRAFASTDRTSLGRHVPAEFAARWSRHLRCDGCHGGVEGLPGILHAGEKLRPDWTRRLLEGGIPYKPRPWLQARMPAYPAYAGLLAAGMAARHGLPPVSPSEPPIDAALAADGRKLVSASGGFACVTCHPIGSLGATAVFEAPGINLARVAERLRPEFFDRWVRHPQSVDPNTKMPLYFDEEGNSALTDFYGGDGNRTILALWNYVRQGTNAPPPEP
jgi:mono/diheme cytochrome c family protein